MKTELEKRLNKLPSDVRVGSIRYELLISKEYIVDEDLFYWCITYKDKFDGNIILEVLHQSLQTAVDTTLKEIKNL